MKKVAEEILFKGDWLMVKRSTFTSPEGSSYSWEHLQRTGPGLAVVILAILRPSNRVVLVREFRPGPGSWVLGLPAGMAETTDAACDAIRELREETGFHGTVTDVGPVCWSFPALSDATVQLVKMNIDEKAAENQAPMQSLEPGEFIKVELVPLDGIKSYLLQQASKGTCLVSGLWYLFSGAEA